MIDFLINTPELHLLLLMGSFLNFMMLYSDDIYKVYKSMYLGSKIFIMTLTIIPFGLIIIAVLFVLFEWLYKICRRE
jgi:hypothetical protein